MNGLWLPAKYRNGLRAYKKEHRMAPGTFFGTPEKGVEVIPAGQIVQMMNDNPAFREAAMLMERIEGVELAPLRVMRKQCVEDGVAHTIAANDEFGKQLQDRKFSGELAEYDKQLEDQIECEDKEIEKLRKRGVIV